MSAATAGKAVYNMVEDTVVLTEDPCLEERDQGFFTKGAQKITYYRKDQRFHAEGDNLQLEFGLPKDKSASTGDLFRTPGSDKGEKTAP